MIEPRAASRMIRSTSLTSPSTRHRSPVTRIISVVEVVDGGWLWLELISQVGASGAGVRSSARPHSARRVSLDEGGYRPERRSKNPPSDACRGATVDSASSVAAREVLLADAANLLPNVFRAGRGRSHMPPTGRGDKVKSTWQKAEEKREEKLELIREQVESGSLVIRKMTKEERRRYPRRPTSPKRPGRR